MKKTILLFILLAVKGFGQMPTDAATGLFMYEGVVKADSLTKDQLFNSAKEWLVRTLKSSDNNVNLNDRESGSLTVTGNLKLEDRAAFCAYRNINLNFKFSVFVK